MRFSGKLLQLASCLVALFGATAFGQINMTLTGVNGNSYAGVYTSPYTATIGPAGGVGVSTTVICDQFSAETYLNQTWTANVTTVAALNSQSYDAIAALSIQLLNTSDATVQKELSFAIWDVFDASGVTNQFNSLGLGTTSNTIYTAAQAYKAAALSASYNGGYDGVSFSNVDVYTPVSCVSPCNGLPQEFLSVGTVSTPEASSSVILAVDLLALGIIVLLFRRRKLGQE